MNKLAIVGTHPGTRGLAPFDNNEYDIWVFNEAASFCERLRETRRRPDKDKDPDPTLSDEDWFAKHDWCKRWDAVFQMHKPEIYTGVNTKDPNHWEWLQKPHGKPIYMQETDERVPDCAPYPLQEATALSGASYFTASLCYAAALAILKGYRSVDVYGVELDANTEYRGQADGWRYWVGMMRGAGVVVKPHSGQHLFSAPLYGYEGNLAFGSDYFSTRAAKYDTEWQSSDKSLQNIKKALLKAVGSKEYEKAQRLTNDLQVAAIATGKLAGALAEAERYAEFGDRYADRGGFEYAGAKAQRDGEAKRVEMIHTGGIIEYLWNAWRATGSNAAENQYTTYLEQFMTRAYDMGALHGIYSDNLEYIAKYDEMTQAAGAKG